MDFMALELITLVILDIMGHGDLRVIVMKSITTTSSISSELVSQMLYSVKFRKLQPLEQRFSGIRQEA